MSKTVLVLGAGMVSGPCVNYLLKNNYGVTVVSAVQADLQRIACHCPSAKNLLMDVAQEASRLQDIISRHDIAISLLPAHLNLQVIKCCIDCKISLVNASYESEDIRALHESAKTAGITILSEVGLDPGIDHMLAMNCIDSVREQGGQITSYVSLCGGLPAPECSNGPLRYKFSWYPKGMFISAMQRARFVRDGNVVEIPEGHIFDRQEIVDNLLEGFELEDVPNRDSTEYIKIYNLQSAETVYRGTLRYKGFGSGMQALISLGLTSSDVVSQLLPGSSSITWRELICTLVGIPSSSSMAAVSGWVQSHLNLTDAQMNNVTELGLLGEGEVPKLNTPLDALCAYLAKQLAYGSEERDMVVMRSVIQTTLPDGRQQQHTIDLVEMGQVKGYSAMAQTVGLTVAICADLLLKGAVTRKGAIMPVTKDIYQPALKMLAAEGIQFKSSVTQLN